MFQNRDEKTLLAVIGRIIHPTSPGRMDPPMTRVGGRPSAAVR